MAFLLTARRSACASVRGALFAVVAAASVVTLLLAGQGCGATWHSPAPLDCSGEGSYDIIERYSVGGTVTWYSYQDTTPGGIITDGGAGDASFPWTRAIEDGGRCGSMAALVLAAEGFHDYGAGFGDYDPGSLQTSCFLPDGGPANCPIDASAYQGIAFWARSPGGHTKAVTLEIADTHSDNAGNNTACTYDPTLEGGTNGGPVVQITQIGAGGGTTLIGGLPPFPPGTCGDLFNYVLLTTDEWQLYKVPFASFYQNPTYGGSTAQARAPGGFDPSTFYRIIIVVPKEANLELWIDELGFYPKRAPDGGP